MAFNATQRVVKLPIGVAIARLELTRIEERVQRPHGGRANIRRPEMSTELWPLPERLKGRAKEIEATRNLRNQDARLPSIDRMTIAVQSLCEDLDKFERTSAFQRVFLYVGTPILFWLILRAADISTYMSKDLAKSYNAFVASVPTFVPLLIFGLITPALTALVSKDAREAFKRVFGIGNS